MANLNNVSFICQSQYTGMVCGSGEISQRKNSLIYQYFRIENTFFSSFFSIYQYFPIKKYFLINRAKFRHLIYIYFLYKKLQLPGKFSEATLVYLIKLEHGWTDGQIEVINSFQICLKC